MATLTGNAINTSYQGLIKLDDNGIVDPTALKQLTDGTGGSLPIQVSQVQTKFQTAVDFTGVTVTGLPGGAGLVSGTGNDSMQSAASLTTTPANASGCNSIVLGECARDVSGSGIVYGAIVIGWDACTNKDQTIVIGQEASSNQQGGIAIGLQAKVCGSQFGMALGRATVAAGYMSAAIGTGAKAVAGGFNQGATAVGNNACATANCSIALGANVVASKVGTATVNELEVAAVGGGIYLNSPNGTEYKVTVTDGGVLVVA